MIGRLVDRLNEQRIFRPFTHSLGRIMTELGMALPILVALCVAIPSVGCCRSVKKDGDEGQVDEGNSGGGKKEKKGGGIRDIEFHAGGVDSRSTKVVEVPCMASAQKDGQTHVLWEKTNCSFGDRGGPEVTMKGNVKEFEWPGTIRVKITKDAATADKEHTARVTTWSVVSDARIVSYDPEEEMPLAAPFVIVADDGEWKGDLRVSLRVLDPLINDATLTGLKLYADDEVATKKGTALVYPEDDLSKASYKPSFVGKPSRLSEVELIVLLRSKTRKLLTCTYRGPSGTYKLDQAAFDADIRVYDRRTGKKLKSGLVRARGSATCSKSTTDKALDSGSSPHVTNAQIADWLRDNVR